MFHGCRGYLQRNEDGKYFFSFFFWPSGVLRVFCGTALKPG